MYWKKQLTLFIGLLFAMNALGQRQMNTPAVDQQTHSLYLAANWNELIRLGNEALSQGIDFYYLRYRLGMAYYMQGNYHQSIYHLEKAMAYDGKDPLLQETLYYANLFLNRTQEADIIAKNMTRQQRHELNIKQPPLFRQIDVGHGRNVSGKNLPAQPFEANVDPNLNGSQFISAGHTFFYVNMLHTVRPGLSVYHGYTQLKKDHFVYVQSEGDIFTYPKATTNLNQYYIAGIIRVSKTLTLLSGLHYVNMKYPIEVAIDCLGEVCIATQEVGRNEFVGFASIYQHMRYVTLGGAIFYAGLNRQTQMQADAIVTYYPMGNLNLYTTTTLSAQQESRQQHPNSQRLVLNQTLGGRIAPSVWIEAYAHIGETKNLIRDNGMVLYNTMDAIRSQFGGKLIFTFQRPYTINIHYSLSQHESLFQPDAGNHGPLNPKQYHSHSITGGISWRF